MNLIESTIMFLLSLGAKATTCFIPKTSIHLALLTTNPTILNGVFKAGGSSTYILTDGVFKRFQLKTHTSY